MSDQTPLFIYSKQIVDKVDRDISERLMKWRMFSAQWRLETEDYYGKTISYQGMGFDGSPRVVFWGGYIEPFLENGIMNSLTELKNLCSERNLDINDYKNEMKNLLSTLIAKTYNFMADIDQILRGRGYPKSVTKINVSDRIEKMELHLNKCLDAVSHKGLDKVSNVQDVISLKPGIYGFSIDLRALWRKIRKFINGT